MIEFVIGVALVGLFVAAMVTHYWRRRRWAAITVLVVLIVSTVGMALAEIWPFVLIGVLSILRWTENVGSYRR